jgi:hypothetical protein
MHIFFDVDHTIIDSHDGLRPGVRELFVRLRDEGHTVSLWSGLGERWEIVAKHGLAGLVASCYMKPLLQYDLLLQAYGVPVRPDFVVDDHPHLVHHFGGCTVRRYLRPDPADTEMLRVYNEIAAMTAREPR